MWCDFAVGQYRYVCAPTFGKVTWLGDDFANQCTRTSISPRDSIYLRFKSRPPDVGVPDDSTMLVCSAILVLCTPYRTIFVSIDPQVQFYEWLRLIIYQVSVVLPAISRYCFRDISPEYRQWLCMLNWLYSLCTMPTSTIFELSRCRTLISLCLCRMENYD